MGRTVKVDRAVTSHHRRAINRGGGDLLEREDELRLIRAAVEGVAGRQGGILFVEGDAGAGKSRLLVMAEEIADDAGLRLLTASCGELESEFPFGVVLQLFEPVLTALSGAERDVLFAGAARSAAVLFHESTQGDGEVAQEENLFRLIHGLYWLTVSLSEHAGTVIVIDDAHWCDEATLRFLAYLARRLDGLPAALVISSRPAGEQRHPAATADLLANQDAVRLCPKSLSEEAVSVLISERLSSDAAPEFCASCAHATGGNPFLLHELITEIESSGLKPDRAAAERVDRLVPRSVLSAVVARIARLPEGAADVARAAAGLGHSSTLQRCALVAGIDLSTAELAANALVDAGLFDGTAEAMFSHPLIRLTVERDMSAAARAAAHKRAAEVLHAQGERTEIVAAHLLEGAAGAGDGWVVEALRIAARRAVAGGNPSRAVALLQRARAEGVPLDLRGALLAELGLAQALSADPCALDTLDEALGHTSGPVERAVLHRRRGDLLFSQHRPDDAASEYERGIAGLDSDSASARDLQAARAIAMFLVPGGMEEALAGVSVIAQRPDGGIPAERGLLAQVALRMALTGEPREHTRSLALKAWGDGALLEDEGPDGHVWSLVTGALSFAGFFADSIAVVDRVAEAAQRVGSVFAFATACYSRSAPLYWQGRITEATADAQRAADARNDGWSAWAGSTSYMLSNCLIESGDREQAEKVLEDPDDPRWSETIEGLTVLQGRAWLQLTKGRNKEALEDYLSLGRRCEDVFGVKSPVIMPWHSGAALAALHLGDLDQAAELNAAGSELAEQLGAPGPIGRSLWIAGLIRGADGIALIADAVDLLAGTEAQLEYLRALVELGSALRRANRRTDAREPLMSARDLAPKLGAVALEARAADELRAAGARVRRGARNGVHALTASERRVANYAAEGMTNRQIAEMLFVTPKAVEFHLANVYRKLDIGGRPELAQALGPKN